MKVVYHLPETPSKNLAPDDVVLLNPPITITSVSRRRIYGRESSTGKLWVWVKPTRWAKVKAKIRALLKNLST